MTGAMLRIEGVSKRYDDTVLALDDVNLKVERSEIVCLLGPSGCGKTTLLRVIAGLETADEGRVLLDGQDLVRTPVHLRQFGYMFQDFALFPHKSVAENVIFGLRMQDMPAKAAEARVAEMLDLVGLAAYGERSVFELSGGERQRVALARSLAPSPNVLLLDEPLGSLDRTLRENLTVELRGILKQVGVTAIYVTHDQEEAFAMGDRIAIMLAGRIAQEGAPETVYKEPASAEIARFLGFSSLLPISPKAGEPHLLATPLGDIPRSMLPAQVGEEGGLLLIRPDSARAVYSHDANPAVKYPYLSVETGSDPARLLLTGRLAGCAFRGSQYRLTVRAPVSEGGIDLAFDLPAYQSDPSTGRLQPLTSPAIGAPIRLAIYPELTTLLSAGRPVAPAPLRPE